MCLFFSSALPQSLPALSPIDTINTEQIPDSHSSPSSKSVPTPSNKEEMNQDLSFSAPASPQNSELLNSIGVQLPSATVVDASLNSIQDGDWE